MKWFTDPFLMISLLLPVSEVYWRYHSVLSVNRHLGMTSLTEPNDTTVLDVVRCQLVFEKILGSGNAGK